MILPKSVHVIFMLTSLQWPPILLKVKPQIFTVLHQALHNLLSSYHYLCDHLSQYFPLAHSVPATPALLVFLEHSRYVPSSGLYTPVALFCDDFPPDSLKKKSSLPSFRTFLTMLLSPNHLFLFPVLFFP